MVPALGGYPCTVEPELSLRYVRLRGYGHWANEARTQQKQLLIILVLVVLETMAAVGLKNLLHY
ncbi:hypothetical protein NECAME_05208 [Necator americanus]|uniref:Uncharacterized protein n=1 Tax=Necator americanus TaxID=51031 RepID=W2SL74_NECAM|nr:hypothetical protein NECAME_05208 [Necator americanus]ETN69626.1 hypothetical protein NECAME_05208 [Necator americanus]